MADESEVGRELSVAALRTLIAEGPRVVVVRREDRDIALTLWCMEVGKELAVFHGAASVPRITFVALIEGDTLVDDTGRQIKAYEYRGEV